MFLFPTRTIRNEKKIDKNPNNLMKNGFSLNWQVFVEKSRSLFAARRTSFIFHKKATK